LRLSKLSIGYCTKMTQSCDSFFYIFGRKRGYPLRKMTDFFIEFKTGVEFDRISCTVGPRPLNKQLTFHPKTEVA